MSFPVEHDTSMREAARCSFHAMAFGCRWQSDLPLPSFEPAATHGMSADIHVRLLTDTPPAIEAAVTVNRVAHTRYGFRYAAEDLIADTRSRSLVEVRRGPEWQGHLPASFFGTVTAALMTWRGGIAMHGSAVEVDGKGILICGASGSGKSTLAAGLIALGGQLISDDLSVLWPQASGKAPALFAGRRTMRLFPDVAGMLGDCISLESGPSDDGAKSLIVPPRTGASVALPLGCVLLLGEDRVAATGEARLLALRRQRYRPRSLKHIPGHALRIMQLTALSTTVPVLTLPKREARSLQAFRDGAARVLDAIREARSL